VGARQLIIFVLGTNTDAVAVDVAGHASENRGVIAHFKTPTTPDITTGIETALKYVLETPQVVTERVTSVTVGTTHFINAVIEQGE
jgi:N-methylhydantoinase A/oxoprolinase/acetone carboxylase beta subunit